ncbi:hypothetical protein GCM10010149_61930 [Nonomuraea roseoviolacea subsp. roseoviolacea]
MPCPVRHRCGTHVRAARHTPSGGRPPWKPGRNDTSRSFLPWSYRQWAAVSTRLRLRDLITAPPHSTVRPATGSRASTSPASRRSPA